MNIRILKFSFTLILCLIMGNTMAQNGMQLAQYTELKAKSKPQSRYYYGNDTKVQFADLYLPTSGEISSLLPVVALIHGGCWDESYQGLQQMGAIADSLLNEGFAVWNIEYRCANYDGGGYPGTYQDIHNALLKLQEIADQNKLDTNRIIVVGHSAGGHLALWSAKSNAIDTESVLHSNQKLQIKTVIGLGSILDLNKAQEACPNIADFGGNDVLIKQASDQRTNPLKDTSPIAMNQTTVPTVLIHGANDIIAPPAYALDYASKADLNNEQAAPVTIIIVPQTTHYDEVSPTSSVWAFLLNEIKRAAQ